MVLAGIFLCDTRKTGMAGAVTSSDYNRGDDFGRVKKQTEAPATGAFVALTAGWCADCNSGPASKRELQPP